MQEAYRRIASDNDVIKSIDDTENIDSSSFSSSDITAQPNNNNTPTLSIGSQNATTTVATTSMHPQKRNNILDRSTAFTSSATIETVSDCNVTRTTNVTSSNAIASQMDGSNVTVSNTLISDISTPTCNLAAFLIHRACRNPTLSNYLYWYLYIECESQDTVRKQDEKVKNMYDKVLKIFKRTLMASTELKSIKLNLEKQQLFIDELVKLVKCVAKESGNRKKKCEKFQQLLGDGDAFRINFSHFDPIPLPLDPEIIIRGIVPTKVSLFKSALMPSK